MRKHLAGWDALNDAITQLDEAPLGLRNPDPLDLFGGSNFLLEARQKAHGKTCPILLRQLHRIVLDFAK